MTITGFFHPKVLSKKKIWRTCKVEESCFFNRLVLGSYGIGKRVLIQTLIRNYSWLTMYEWWKRPFIFLPLCMSRSDCNGVTSLEPDYVHVSYGTKSLARKKKRDKCKSCINHRITLWIDQFSMTPPPFMTFFASHCERLSSVESFHRLDRELYYFFPIVLHQ